MKAILVLLGFTLACNQTPVHAAPSIEACPQDSVIFEDVCKCDPATCSKPPCLTDLKVYTNGTDEPGKCCPFYECVGCKDEDKIDGNCPCAEGAVIDGYKCKCVDEEKHLVDGKCVCNPQLCPFPELCDKKSVAVSINKGCCKKTICTPCPSDSESSNLEGDDLENHCVCLPCKTECGFNRTVVIKKYGKGFAGNCCDLYECKKYEEILETKGCIYGELFYENGKEWRTQDLQICKCDNGLALCSNQKEDEELSCFVDNHLLYKHSENWTKDDGCTICTCKNGVHECISHYCHGKENLIQVNQSCLRDDIIYRHGETFPADNGCSLCTCNNGNESCVYRCYSAESSSTESMTGLTTVKIVECHSLESCNKSCPFGYRVNRRGCEICKCKADKLGQGQEDILTRYNISMNQLIHILDKFKEENSTAATSTSSFATNFTSSSTSSSISSSTPSSTSSSTSSSTPSFTSSSTPSSTSSSTPSSTSSSTPNYTSSSTSNSSPSSTSSSTSSSTPWAVISSTTTTTTSTSKSVEVVTQVPVVIMNRNAFEETKLTTTEPSRRPTDIESDPVIYIVILIIVCLIFGVAVGILIVYRSRRKSSVDLPNCRYQNVNGVNGNNNNNTIKKSDPLI